MSRQTLLFLGATGGVTNAILTHALQSNDYNCIALVRTPSKLTTQLSTQQKLSESHLANLTTIEGNALDQDAIRRALLTNNNTLPDMIISGLGAAPVFSFNIWRPLSIVSIDQPSLCGDAAQALITTLKSIYAQRPDLATRRPHLCFVSTTGITKGAEDVPWSMRFLYHQLLAVPHIDKRKMEEVFRGPGGSEVFSSITGARPTLLTGTGVASEAKGLEKIRAGTEEKPELGFTISREDVGGWVFENVVRGMRGQNGGKSWLGEMASLTY